VGDTALVVADGATVAVIEVAGAARGWRLVRLLA